MPATATEGTLGEFFGAIALRHLMERKPLGGYEVQLGPLMTRVSFWMFQVGCVLGRALQDRLPVLVKLIPMSADGPQPEQKVCGILAKLATERLQHYGREPESLTDFWLETEFKISLSDLSSEAFQGLCKHRIPLDKILSDRKLDEWLAWGMGFGAAYPQLLENAWVNTFEKIDTEAWAFSRHHGLALPEEPTPLPLKDTQAVILADTRGYVQTYFPELLEPLGFG